MEDWKLPQIQIEPDWEVQAPLIELHDAHWSKSVIQQEENLDAVELIHQRRRDSLPKAESVQIHNIPIESRYNVVTPPESEKDEDPDALLRNMKESPHTLLDKQCIAQDVINIWEAISEYIILKLKRGLGTIIPGLGTFTYLIKNVPFPKSKSCKLHIYPKFFLSEYVAEMYRLDQDISHHSNVPTKLINLSIISQRINIPRPIIEGAITEVLQAFARGIVCNKNIEFPFPCIGKLQVFNQRVRMRFYLDFYKSLKYNIEVPSVLKMDGKDIEDSVIEGRMTPLVYHIPQPQFRSVFHLREVRSVHEGPLLAPVEYHKGRLIPETMMKDVLKKEEMFEYLDKDKYDGNISLGPPRSNPAISLPPSPLSHMGSLSKASRQSIRSPTDEIISNLSLEGSPKELSESVILSAVSRFTGTESNVDEAELHYIYNPKPLYLEQQTGIEILDKRLEDPYAFTKELEKHVLGKAIKTLGHAKVYSHLVRTMNIRPKKYGQRTSFFHLDI